MESGGQKVVISVIVLAVIALAIAGCGGGSSTSTSTAASAASKVAAPRKSTPSESRFIGQADTICGRLNAQLATVKVKSRSAKEIARVVPRNFSLEQSGLRELEKLTAPSSLAPGWRSMLGYRQALASELAELARDAQHNDLAAENKLVAAKKTAHIGLTKAAAEYGFKDCAAVG
jgi:hypothetical protein